MIIPGNLVMSRDSRYLNWPQGILCILFLSLVIVSLDLAVEVLLNPSATSIIDRLIYRFGLMFIVSFVTFIVAFHVLRTRIFVMSEK